MKRILAVSVLFIFILGTGAYAQFGGKPQQVPRFYADFKPVVGGWSEYQIKTQKEAPSKMKIAIIDKEGQAYWYETVMEMQQGRIVTKMLVSGNPDDQKNLKRMIMKQGNQPAIEMPSMAQGKPAKGQKPRGKMVDKGMETVKVPAGTFTAHHFQYQGEEGVVDTWVNEKISPYGMVKTQSKDMEMVLLGYGTGAKSLITEKPQKFQMPQMPKGMVPPGMGNPGGE